MSQPTRISVLRSLTRKIGEVYQKTEFRVEADLAAGLTLEEGLAEANETVQKALIKATEEPHVERGTIKQSDTPVPQKPSPPQPARETAPPSVPVQPEPGSLATITDEQLATELDKQAWRQNRTGKGWNMRWEDLPLPIRAKLANKFSELQGTQYVKLGGYNYRRYGDESEWLARYGSTKTKETATA
jgi:hypothetical protein